MTTTVLLSSIITAVILCFCRIVASSSFMQEEVVAPSSQSPAKPSFLYILIDDVGWADLSYNGGIAQTPNIDSWSRRSGSIQLMDFHSFPVCSPTRASVLTGRNHFRDCVDSAYGCRDMSTCVPDFEFAPSNTFTVGDAVRAADPKYNNDGVFFVGKWHLGSFYNDSEAYGGITSSPITHGFHHFNATVGNAPTMTVNCQCHKNWENQCQFGHYERQRGCKNLESCCLNYWWDDAKEPHGVANLTWPAEPDDALYQVDAFHRFLLTRKSRTSTSNNEGPDPFLAQISFRNCHLPFIGTQEAISSCAANVTCSPPKDGESLYSDKELDYYACLTQLDDAMGKLLQILENEGYYENTMVWFSSDNGPEKNCPNGICERANDSPQRPVEGPGSAGELRGRKRDVYEGGHRVPAIISWPAYITIHNNNHATTANNNHNIMIHDNNYATTANNDDNPLVSWETVSVVDFLPTVMDVLGVDRPPSQQSWAMDGKSVLPILRGEKWPETEARELGFGFYHPRQAKIKAWGYRYGKWKYVEAGSRPPQLFDLEHDLGERNDLSEQYPETLVDIQHRFLLWHRSIMSSRSQVESNCSNPNFQEKIYPPDIYPPTITGSISGSPTTSSPITTLPPTANSTVSSAFRIPVSSLIPSWLFQIFGFLSNIFVF